MNMILKQAYSEVDEFLELLPKEILEKIPKSVRNVYKENKDKNYKKNIDPSIDIKNQYLLPETLTMLAILYMDYICDNEEEKKKLNDIYKKNQEEYDNFYKANFDENTIFGK